MRVLITGGSGKLGRELVKLLPKDTLAPINPHYPSDYEKDWLNIGDKDRVFEYVARYKPDVVIHLAAFVSPPLCEIHKEKAWFTNVIGTKNLVEACEMFAPKCYFLLMSTPCVFSGKEGNYDETSISYPENFYGSTKLIQEIVVQQSKLRWCIVRGNFVPREKYPYPKAFNDRFGTYLFADQLANAIVDVVNLRATGIIHLVGNKKISMLELAIRCPDSVDVQSMSYEEYYRENPNTVKLTKDMSLVTKRWHKEYDIDG